MKRLLLLTYRFPPVAGPQEIRWLYFLVNLAQRGWQICVLTADPTAVRGVWDESLLEYWPPSAKIIYTRPGPFLRRGNERPMLEWPLMALRAGWGLAKRSDILISSVPPNFSPHLAAALLSRGTGCPWVADYGDPWVFNPLYRATRWHRQIAEVLERLLLRMTKRVMVTTEATSRAYQSYVPDLPPNHFTVVPCGYPAALYRTLSDVEPFESFTLVYTGGFYPGLRSPEAFFEALIQLGERAPQVLIAGASLSAWESKLTHPVLTQKVRVMPYMPHREAARLQRRATILLLIGNRSPWQIPGKLYEYIGARRPILALQNGPEDASGAVIHSLQRGLVVPNEPEAIAEAIAQLQDVWENGRLDEQFDLSERPEWSWEVLTDVVEDILLEAMAA
jgi:glycosyltransferase involved in cell wall biosynthesis